MGEAVDAVGALQQVARGDAATLPLRALTVGQRYYVAVEAFDERGVSRLSRVAAM